MAETRLVLFPETTDIESGDIFYTTDVSTANSEERRATLQTVANSILTNVAASGTFNPSDLVVFNDASDNITYRATLEDFTKYAVELGVTDLEVITDLSQLDNIIVIDTVPNPVAKRITFSNFLDDAYTRPSINTGTDVNDTFCIGRGTDAIRVRESVVAEEIINNRTTASSVLGVDEFLIRRATPTAAAMKISVDNIADYVVANSVGGSARTVSNTFEYDTSTSSSALQRHIKFNNTTVENATEMYVDLSNIDDHDAPMYFIPAGTRVAITRDRANTPSTGVQVVIFTVTSRTLINGGQTASYTLSDVQGNLDPSNGEALTIQPLGVGNGGDWTNLSLTSGWTANTLRYKLVSGTCHLQTDIIRRTEGASTIMATLPVGLRPTTTIRWKANTRVGSSEEVHDLIINTSGQIETGYSGSTNPVDISVGEIQFRVD